MGNMKMVKIIITCIFTKRAFENKERSYEKMAENITWKKILRPDARPADISLQRISDLPSRSGIFQCSFYKINITLYLK
jgi:hypothetical protein